MKLSLSLLLSVIPVSSFVYDICVVGAGGGLGRELVYQATTERNNTVLALTTSEKIKRNRRRGGLLVEGGSGGCQQARTSISC